MVQEIPDLLGESYCQFFEIVLMFRIGVEVAEFLIQTHGGGGPHSPATRAKL